MILRSVKIENQSDTTFMKQQQINNLTDNDKDTSPIHIMATT